MASNKLNNLINLIRYIKCKTDSGIETSVDGLVIKLNITYSGLKMDADGLSLDAKYTSGTSLPTTANDGDIFFLYST